MRRRFGCSWMAHITRSGAAYTHDLLSLGSYPKLIRRLTWRSAPRGGGDEDLTDWRYSARVGQAAGTDRLFLREAGCRRMRSRNPVEQPAPSLVAAALAASRRQQRRLSRRLLR